MGARRRQAQLQHRHQQRARVVVLRPLQHIRTGALLDAAPSVHHRQMVGDGRQQRDVVGDEQAARTALALQPALQPAQQPAQQLDDLHLHAVIRRRIPFVADDQRRVDRQHRRDPQCCDPAVYTDSMRLTDAERAQIGWAARDVLPPGSRVLLFGSRTDDSRRGGDIDRLVEPPAAVDAAQEIALCSRLMVQLYRRIGERRIDIVIARPGTADDRHVVAEARRHGIELVQT